MRNCFLHLLLHVCLSYCWAQSLFCSNTHAPPTLAAVSVWVKHRDEASSIFRISDEDQSDEGFKRSSADRDNFVVLLPRTDTGCSSPSCSIKLSNFRRTSDGAEIHVDSSISGTPPGYEDVNNNFYCARAIGDCGADLPIFRWSRGRNNNFVHAYSFDPSASISGYNRDAVPMCYGWSDGGSVVSAHQNVNNSNEFCIKTSPVLNGKISYSSTGSSLYPIGTTAALQCEQGYMATGQTSLLCTKEGWYPSSGLGHCESPQKIRFSAISSGSTDSISQDQCSASINIDNGNIMYSAIPVDGKLDSGATATVLCNLGYISSCPQPFHCSQGKWTPSISEYQLCLPASQVKCPPPMRPMNGKINFNTSVNRPFEMSSRADLVCNDGFIAAGPESITCTSSGWMPPMLGACTQNIRPKRQGIAATCPPLLPVGGSVSYIQTNANVLYSSGSSALLKCDMGYSVQGFVSTVCFNGQWTPTLGTCQMGSTTSTLGGGNINTGSTGNSCKDFNVPVNGAISYSTSSTDLGSHPTGTIATLNCNAGSTVSGALSSTCSSGTWSPAAIGTCGTGSSIPASLSNTQLECSTPTVLNGVVGFSQSSPSEPQKPVGTVATISCNIGYTVSGLPFSTCVNGAWSPPMPQCTSGGSGTVPGIGSQVQQCTMIGTPLGGTITYSSGSLFGPYIEGSTATLRCNNNQLPIGASSAVCTAGQWNPMVLGTCPLDGTNNNNNNNSQQCLTALSAPFGTSVTYSNGGIFGPFPVNTVATARCMDTTMQVNGASTSTCLNGQWQPLTLGTCASGGLGGTGTSCIMGLTPTGGTITYSNGQIFAPFTSGTIATQQCPSGTPSTSSCINGIWTPSTLPSCTGGGGIGTTCQAIPTPLGGTVIYSNNNGLSYPSGTTATLTCTSGLPLGSSIATCTNGIWSALGTCSGTGTGTNQQCITPAATVLGATVTYSNQQTFGPWPQGTTATLTCPLSQLPSGSTTSTCTSGQWQPLLATTCGGNGNTNTIGCLPLSAVSSPVLNGHANYVPNAVERVTVGTTATLVCSANYVASGATSVQCTNNGWNPPALGQCVSQGCLPFSDFISKSPNGVVSYSPGVSRRVAEGTSATLECLPGFIPQGVSQSRCTSQGWNPPQLGHCVSQGGGTGTSCLAMAAPLNGALTYSQGGSLGPFPQSSTATLTCNMGYTINGVSSAMCQNGFWTPAQLGQCTGAGGTLPNASSQCYFGLPMVLHGRVQYSNNMEFGPYNSGTTATLTCDANYNPSGSSTSTCQNGQWMPTLLGTCVSGLGGNDLLTQCQAVPFILSGTVSYSQLDLPPYREGTTATLTCNLGSTLSGQSIVTCRSGGWSPFPGLGSCMNTLARSPVKPILSDTSVAMVDHQQDCSSPLAPPFGELTFSRISSLNGSFPGGTTAALRCEPGYKIEGPSFSTCRRGLFRPIIGKCTNGQQPMLPGACLPLASPLNGKVMYIQSSREVKLEVGTTAILHCGDGLAVTGTATLLCSHDGWQPSEGFGSCDAVNNSIS